MSKPVFVGNQTHFPGIGRILFEGAESNNPLAFKFYDENKRVGGKTMREHLRFAACYWHSFLGVGADPFGPGTRRHSWDRPGDAMAKAEARVDAAFEFFSKLGVPYYCFHDVDLAPEGDDLVSSERQLQHMVGLAKERQRATDVELLWGIANLCTHPRYAHGAATNPDFAVVARAGSQVMAALEATVALGGLNYVFWNGREGYACLLNTDMRRERDHYARFLILARDYGRSIGFRGNFLIEPKPLEPMRHQYDFDAATVIAFLREHGLADDFKLNIEANHATLAGHTFEHDVQVCADAGMLGSLDVNRGDCQNGWDTVHFPLDIHDNVAVLMVLLRHGGLPNGGLNIDAKLRRESTDPEDLFIGHIGAMDAFARALEIAHGLLHESPIEDWRRRRYQNFDQDVGRAFERGGSDLARLRQHALVSAEVKRISGRQEAYEQLVNQYRVGASANARNGRKLSGAQK